MHTFEWNALRVGDAVTVHDPGSPELELVPGVVSMFNSSDGSHSVGIRITRADGETLVVCPPRQAVHLPASGLEGSCWRCSTLRPAA